MDIKNNLSSSYRNDHYPPLSTNEKQRVDHTKDPFFSNLDSTIASLRTASPQHLHFVNTRRIDRISIARYFFLASIFFKFLGVTSTLLFFLMISQPLLVAIFTFGECLFKDLQEWVDFTQEILWLSMLPFFSAALFFCLSYFTQRGKEHCMHLKGDET